MRTHAAGRTLLLATRAALLLLVGRRAQAQPRCEAPADSLAQAFFDEKQPAGLVVHLLRAGAEQP